GEFQEVGRLGGRGDDVVDWEVSAAGKGGREDGEGLDSRDRGHPHPQLWKDLVRRALSLVPGLAHAAVEPAGGEGDLEGEVRLRDLLELRVDGARRLRHLVERGVRRSVEDAEDHALVLGW